MNSLTITSSVYMLEEYLCTSYSFSGFFYFKVCKNSSMRKCLSQYISLTIVAIETSPNKLVVVCDLVDNSTEAAYTVLDNLGSRHNK